MYARKQLWRPKAIQSTCGSKTLTSKTKAWAKSTQFNCICFRCFYWLNMKKWGQQWKHWIKGVKLTICKYLQTRQTFMHYVELRGKYSKTSFALIPLLWLIRQKPSQPFWPTMLDSRHTLRVYIGLLYGFIEHAFLK